ncbi:MAG: RagB/SusD family nutrient uptake outer membrane protein [Flavobacteriaceae bacterium]|nr:RagB/SusD family nutrient uptake outer membrane protein [Flavobacteriaceae bacterium]
MKTLKKIILTSVSVTLFGCADDLDKNPIGLITSDQISTDVTASGIVSGINSSYELLSNTLNIIGNWDWTGGKVFRNDFILQDIASGDMNKKWNPDGDQTWMDEVAAFNFTSENGAFNGIWSYNYEGIARVNQGISLLTNNETVNQAGLSSELRDRMLGEVLFLRAFYYFDLVQNFGDVPLILKPLDNFQDAFTVSSRIDKETVLAQIKSDLSEAKLLLPPTKYSSNEEPWRASKGAVIALQAKIALYNKEWENVITIISELENLGFYSLNNLYFDSFDISKEFTENEVVFAYDHKEVQNPRKGNGFGAVMSWGFMAPTQSFLDEFEANDPRLDYTVNVEEKLVYKIYGVTNASFRGNDDSPGNRIFIRWADILLWKAEALLETSNYQDAIEIINSIRARARNTPPLDGIMLPSGTLADWNESSTDKTQIMNWLIHERRVELGFESQRFNDLKRWGIAQEFLTGLGKNFQSFHLLYPIPQRDIEKSGGLISQNPGY